LRQFDAPDALLLSILLNHEYGKVLVATPGVYAEFDQPEAPL
jgi:hypothetical protein